MPVDMVATANAPPDTVAAALIVDGVPDVTDSNPHLKLTRGHVEVRTSSLY